MNTFSISQKSEEQPKSKVGQFWKNKDSGNIYILAEDTNGYFVLVSLATGSIYLNTRGDSWDLDSAFVNNKRDFELINNSFTIHPSK